MIENLKIATASMTFWFGYYWYKIFNKTPWYSYLSLRKLFYTSNTQFNKRLSARIARENPAYAIEPKGILGDFSDQDVTKIAQEIQQNGYYVFPAFSVRRKDRLP